MPPQRDDDSAFAQMMEQSRPRWFCDGAVWQRIGLVVLFGFAAWIVIWAWIKLPAEPEIHLEPEGVPVFDDPGNE